LLGVSVLKLFVTLALAISCKSVYLQAHQPVVKPYPKINTKRQYLSVCCHPVAIVQPAPVFGCVRLFSNVVAVIPENVIPAFF